MAEVPDCGDPPRPDFPLISTDHVTVLLCFSSEEIFSRYLQPALIARLLLLLLLKPVYLQCYPHILLLLLLIIGG